MLLRLGFWGLVVAVMVGWLFGLCFGCLNFVGCLVVYLGFTVVLFCILLVLLFLVYYEGL